MLLNLTSWEKRPRCTKMLLVPVVMVIAYFIFKRPIPNISCALSTNTYLRKHLLKHGGLVFHTLLLALIALAISILRLELFLTLHMYITASLICSLWWLFGWLSHRTYFEGFIFGILTELSIQGCVKSHNQWSIMGDFTNLPQKEFTQWIKRDHWSASGSHYTVNQIRAQILFLQEPPGPRRASSRPRCAPACASALERKGLSCV